MVADRHFPNCSDPRELVQSETRIEMHRSCLQHFSATTFQPQISHRFYRTNTHAAVEAAFETIATRRKEIAGPAIEAYTINKIALTLRRF